ncbi:MAG TPA: hypothetical protein VFW94_05680 [Candidatus Acidoferrales bacterium]|nr:hypothetical protein [Candidatus Acidoferrales bacterium]
MKTKHWFSSAILTAVLVCAGVAIAQRPGVDIDGHRHPNLAEAQQHIQQAYAKIEEAQQDNRYKLGDHADKAKQLLAQASRELKAAAEFSNRRR